MEHYAGCQCCVRFLRQRLHYKDPIDKGHLIVLGAHKHTPTDENMLRFALWSYVLCRTFNRLRHTGSASGSGQELEGMMEQYLRDAVNGCELGIAFISQCWDARYRISDIGELPSASADDDSDFFI